MKTTAAMIALSFAVVACMGVAYGLNPLNDDDKYYDNDGDGLLNYEEFDAGSDPNNWDSDGDGLPDGWEADVGMSPVDPSDADDDFDYFGGEENAHFDAVEFPYDNYAEYYRLAYIDVETGENVYWYTDPNNPDTDGDGILDPDDEYPWDDDEQNSPPEGGPTKPNPGPPLPPDEEDPDNDGLKNREEYEIGTDPNNPDTDGDGLIDSAELRYDLDPNDWDTDNDMLLDSVEEGSGGSTDGHVTDTDNDGIY